MKKSYGKSRLCKVLGMISMGVFACAQMSAAADITIGASLTFDPLGDNYTQFSNPITTWTTNDAPYISYGRVLTLTNGGSCVQQLVKIASDTWGSGKLMIHGAGSAFSNRTAGVTSYLAYGIGASGTLSIRAGGRFINDLNNATFYAGNGSYNASYPPLGPTEVVVDGANSLLKCYFTTIGNHSYSASMVVTNGASFETKQLTLGATLANNTNTSVTGLVVVAGSGSRIVGTDYFNLGNDDCAQGILRVQDGALLTNNAYIQIALYSRNTDARSPLDGRGWLYVEGSNSAAYVGNGVQGLYVGGYSGGVTGGVGTVALSGGGKVEVTGALRVYTNSVLSFEIGPEFKPIHATGNIALNDGAKVEVSLQSGFRPGQAVTYTLVQSDTSLTADLTKLGLNSLSIPNSWVQFFKTGTALQMKFTSGTVVTFR